MHNIGGINSNWINYNKVHTITLLPYLPDTAILFILKDKLRDYYKNFKKLFVYSLLEKWWIEK